MSLPTRTLSRTSRGICVRFHLRFCDSVCDRPPTTRRCPCAWTTPGSLLALNTRVFAHSVVCLHRSAQSAVTPAFGTQSLSAFFAPPDLRAVCPSRSGPGSCGAMRPYLASPSGGKRAPHTAERWSCLSLLQPPHSRCRLPSEVAGLAENGWT